MDRRRLRSDATVERSRLFSRASGHQSRKVRQSEKIVRRSAFLEASRPAGLLEASYTRACAHIRNRPLPHLSTRTGGSGNCGMSENELLGRSIEGCLTALRARRNRVPTTQRLLMIAAVDGRADAATGGIDRHGGSSPLLDRAVEGDLASLSASVEALNEFHVIGESAGGCDDRRRDRGHGKFCVWFHVMFGFRVIC
jgi:hypothetical protein